MKLFRNLTFKSLYHLTVPQHWVIPTMSVLIGAAVSFDNTLCLNWLTLILTLFCGFFFLLSINVLNNFRDYISNNDTAENCTLHPMDNPILSCDISPLFALLFGFACFGCAGIIGIIIIILTTPWILIFAIIALITIIGYTLFPIPFSALPVGELLSGIVEGCVLCLASEYIQTQVFIFSHVLYYLPVALAISGIMFANNCTDIEKDLASNRHTLPSYLPKKSLRLILCCIMWCAAIIILLLTLQVFNTLLYYNLIIVIPLVIILIFISKKVFAYAITADNRNVFMHLVVSAHKWITCTLLAVIILDICTKYLL